MISAGLLQRLIHVGGECAREEEEEGVLLNMRLSLCIFLNFFSPFSRLLVFFLLCVKRVGAEPVWWWPRFCCVDFQPVPQVSPRRQFDGDENSSFNKHMT